MNLSATHAYRADIDGLRAIAVLAVIAFHANPRLLPGGFVGVDFFFVISGYLITGLIAKGIETDTFSFTDFYARRIKRIFPAYILVAFVTLVVSSYLLIPNDYIFYTTSLAASFAFLSNVFFSMLSWGYFGTRSEEFPLLHTWSLSVEEQFYFIFPILLIGLYRYCRRYVPHVLFSLAIVFILFSEFKAGNSKAYFLLSSRAHELLIGALTYFIAQKTPLPSSRQAALLALTGLALMFGSALWIHQGISFPGVNSLYPCIGTALVIYAGRSGNAVSSILRYKGMVAVGLISYSLYLWHWPIFSFLKYRQIPLTATTSAAAIALSFLLAALTYRFVEKPIRQNRRIGFKWAFLKLYALPASAFMAVGLYSYLTEGAPVRFSADTRELISSYSFERDLTRSCSIREEDYRQVTLDYLTQHCAFGETARQKADVLLIGDSHAHHFKPFVEKLVSNAGLKGVYHVQGACAPALTAFQLASRQSVSESCQKRNADLFRIAGEFRYVVLGGYWSSDYLDLPEVEKGLQRAVEKIMQANAIPVLIKDNPDHEADLSKCVLYKKRGWIPEERNCNIPHDYMVRNTGISDQMIDRVQALFPAAIVIDPKKVMCNSAECATAIGNIALYKDNNHLNSVAAKLIAEKYIAQLANPLITGSVNRHLVGRRPAQNVLQ